MRRSFNPGKEPSFQKIVISSFVLHLVFIALTVIPLVHKKKEIKNYYVSLVNPAVVRKAEVPDATKKITVAEKKVVEKEKKILPEKKIKEETKVVKMSTEPTLSQRIKDKEREQEQKREKEEKARKLRDIAANLKTNAKNTAEVSSGTSNLYEGMKIDDAYLLYVDLIRQRIWGYWKSPKVDTEGLSVIVEIKFTKDWRIEKFIPNEISKTKLYNDSVFKAILMAQESSKVSPFPPPPPGYEQDALDGIVITFSP